MLSASEKTGPQVAGPCVPQMSSFSENCSLRLFDLRMQKLKIMIKRGRKHLPELGTFGISVISSIIKNDLFAFFIKLITYFCISPI